MKNSSPRKAAPVTDKAVAKFLATAIRKKKVRVTHVVEESRHYYFYEAVMCQFPDGEHSSISVRLEEVYAMSITPPNSHFAGVVRFREHGASITDDGSSLTVTEFLQRYATTKLRARKQVIKRMEAEIVVLAKKVNESRNHKVRAALRKDIKLWKKGLKDFASGKMSIR